MSNENGTQRKFNAALREIFESGMQRARRPLETADGVEMWMEELELPDGRRVVVIQRFPRDESEQTNRAPDWADVYEAWLISSTVGYYEVA